MTYHFQRVDFPVSIPIQLLIIVTEAINTIIDPQTVMKMP